MPEPFPTHSFKIEPRADDSLREQIEQYLLDSNRKIIMPDIARYVNSENRFIYQKGSFWVYDDSSGVWILCSDSEINMRISRFLYALHKPLTHPATIASVRQHLTDQVIVDSDRRDALYTSKYPNMINVRNGMLDITTGKLYAHHREYYSFYQIPIRYDCEAKCPKFEEFLWFAMDKDEDMVEVLLRYMAYVVSDRTDIQYYTHIIGTTGTGKSTFAKVMESLIGSNLTAILALYNAKNNLFFLESIVGKKFILVNELDEQYMEPAVESIMKNLTGFDSLQVSRKYEKAVNYKNEAKILVHSNNFPQMRDASGALFRRLLLFQWNNRISEKRADEWFAVTNGFQTEMAGILNLVVQAYARMTRDRIPISKPPKMLELIDEYRGHANQILQWQQDRARIDRDGSNPDWKESTEDLHNDYLKWCNEIHMKSQYIMNRVEFSKRLLQTFHGVVTNDRDMNKSYKKGIQLLYPSKPRETAWI